ncbi:MAG TPA: TolC family protein, partial [Thermoanaerobaculia bacterium]|nr:TolC family protein [Thermoanaerobaculia bacterium]
MAAPFAAIAQTATAPAPPQPTGVQSANPTAQPPGADTGVPPPPPQMETTEIQTTITPEMAKALDRVQQQRSKSHGQTITLNPALAPPPEPGATVLTLQQALGRALQVNNTIERSQADVQVAEANKSYLFSQVMPRIVTSGSAIRNSTEVAFGSGTDSRTILPQNDWNYRVVLSQPVYAGNRERRAYEQARIGVANAQESARGTEDAVLLRVASNYLGILDADARIAVERQNIE